MRVLLSCLNRWQQAESIHLLQLMSGQAGIQLEVPQARAHNSSQTKDPGEQESLGEGQSILRCPRAVSLPLLLVTYGVLSSATNMPRMTAMRMRTPFTSALRTVRAPQFPPESVRDIHSFGKCLLKMYCIPGTRQSAGTIAVNVRGPVPQLLLF